MTIIGIDPGAGGAVAVWDKGISKIHKCPKTTTVMADVIKSAMNSENIFAYVEQVHAFPHDGRSSIFKFGKNYGEWLGILGAYRIETTLVSPQKWMKYWQTKLNIKLPKDKPERKRNLKEIASHYTDKKVTLYNADAILITMYGLYVEQEGEINVSQRGKSKV
tara:strand:+ start:34 stop:522 length:489 start_codon:yes stop_codon:yes gene_type:complete